MFLPSTLHLRKEKQMKKVLLFAAFVVWVPMLVIPQAQGRSYSQEREREALQDSLQNRMRRVPTIPVILDSVEYAAGELPRTDESRFYLLTREDHEKGVVRAFTSRDRAAEFMRFATAKRQADNISTGIMTTTSSCQHPYNYSYFNQARFGGDPEDLYMDLDIFTTSIPSHYANLNFGGWNNTISYVEAACNGLWTTLYSCTNFQLFQSSSCQDPDALAIEPGLVVPDLLPYGFNNRTSSIEFLQF
jgi:hypothetical protein